ncbi:hypothetical protein, partial [Nocardia abscessus]|uniref:hypothetical protein n=1 Tax=Nocardia abscessus TaxID=120957 RepID=UPI0024540E74
IRKAEIALPLILDALRSGADVRGDDFLEHASGKMHDAWLRRNWRAFGAVGSPPQTIGPPPGGGGGAEFRGTQPVRAAC